METFVWDRHFVTGLALVDEQHHGLVDLFNQISRDLIQGNGGGESTLQQTFSRLVDYAKFHFADEEKLMHQHGLDTRHVQMHSGLHVNFMQQVTSMWNSRGLMQNPSGTFVSFLTAWLGLHILGIDQSMARQIAMIDSGHSANEAYAIEATNKDNGTVAMVKAVSKLYTVLSQLNQELASANSLLEQRVEQRTAELALANRRLEEYSHTDGLMQIANRKFFDLQFQKEWQRALREAQPLALLMIDVDYFKRYNDRYGHQAGDACLQAVARAIRVALARPTDMLARYGGEELVVILPNTDKAGAVYVAEGLCSSIAALNIAHAQSDAAPVVTVSVGVSSLLPSAQTGAADLLRLADLALYGAKAAGRNQVCDDADHSAASTNEI